MINLLQETLIDIQRSAHEISDIVFIGTRDGEYSCTWDEFALLADKKYDNGYGTTEVLYTLCIVFDDASLLERQGYAGSENWMYTTPFMGPLHTKPLKNLFSE